VHYYGSFTVSCYKIKLDIKTTVMDQKETTQDSVNLERKYDRLIERLNEERGRVERDVVHEYRNLRRYVRAHPEEGLGMAIAGGLVLGFILGRITQK
jgi:ElaB/YqjD/DUF883 family membrane-anchored ribosome-binding protein